MVELGLPVRLGGVAPISPPVLAGTPFQQAEEAWRSLQHSNGSGRPVALVNPFGGAEQLKGYVQEQFPGLIELIERLIADGYFCILLPGGNEWGSVDRIREVHQRLSPAHRPNAAIGPDPHERTGQVGIAGGGSMPHRTFVMRQFIHFARYAALVVSVEGWMVHAAYTMGKPIRILPMARSNIESWLPYALGPRQGLERVPESTVSLRLGTGPPPAPLAHPRKQALIDLARRSPAFHSETVRDWLAHLSSCVDPDVRRAAVAGMDGFWDDIVLQRLCEMVDDPDVRARGAACGVLLSGGDMLAAERHGLDHQVLQAHYWIGQELPNWDAVVALGPAALPAVQVAARSANDVVRREARAVADYLASELNIGQKPGSP
jgi:hypothetical protein